jgi:hypothetical protein
MKLETTVKGGLIVGIILWLTGVAVIIGVVYHFVSKFW